MTAPDRTTAKDFSQLAFEQRRNARRELHAYMWECREKWPFLTSEERELCQEAFRNLVERAGMLP